MEEMPSTRASPAGPTGLGVWRSRGLSSAPLHAWAQRSRCVDAMDSTALPRDLGWLKAARAQRTAGGTSSQSPPLHRRARRSTKEHEDPRRNTKIHEGTRRSDEERNEDPRRNFEIFVDLRTLRGPSCSGTFVFRAGNNVATIPTYRRTPGASCPVRST